MIKKIGVFSNDNAYSKEILETLMLKLKNEGYIIDNNDFDLAIAIGGDGSFLRMVRNCNFNSRIYYLGINTGTLGFAQEIYPNEIDEFLVMLKENRYKIEEISFGEVRLFNKDNNDKINFLNEILLRDIDLKTIHLDVIVNDFLLENFVGNGLLLTTSFGSTAYNLSYNGTIVYNDLHIMELTPIAPINNKSYHSLRNSVIIPENRKISIIPHSSNLILMCDGKNFIYHDVERLEVTIPKEKIKCLRMNNFDYTKRINEKFLKD